MLARYIGLSTGWFIRVDPNPGTLLSVSSSKYSYVSNNSLARIDPTERETIVFTVARSGSGSKGMFGHAAAIATTDNGQRADISLGTSIAAFVNAYLDEGRTVTAFVLVDDPVRDGQMIGALNRLSHTDYNQISNNCTTVVAAALRESGVISEGQNPEEGVFFDSPDALADALWSTPELASQVELILIFDPDIVNVAEPEQIEELLGIADSSDVESPIISREPPKITREQAREPHTNE